jgi:hypothetical protein
MPTPFTKGAQAAEALFDALEAKGIIGVASGTTGQTDIAVAHGLGEAPDFVLLGGNGSVDEVAAGIQWAATATTLTITVNDTGAPKSVAYLASVLR